MNDLFLPILDDNEMVEKTYKPSKLKFYFASTFSLICFALFVAGFIALALFAPEEGVEPHAPIYWLVPAGAFVFITFVSILCISLCYKKTVYAVTNKRLVIRTGVIGVDYKSLDMAMIGAIDVSVSMIDKILCKNTGSIRFGSNSSPMNGQNASTYIFKHVFEPYKTCKEIKAKIDEYKKEQREIALQK